MRKCIGVGCVVVLAGTVLGLLAAGCGEEETIRVDLLPPGNARGASATGLYLWSEDVTSTSCPTSVAVGATSVALPRLDDVYKSCVDVLQDEGYYGTDFLSFWNGPPAVSRVPYNADGGLWQEGQFRIGGIFSFGTGVTARVLLDGQYLPPSGTTVPGSFEGVGLVQVFTSSAGAERFLCEYRVELNAHRQPDCTAGGS
jgi:hypothetical protein